MAHCNVLVKYIHMHALVQLTNTEHRLVEKNRTVWYSVNSIPSIIYCVFSNINLSVSHSSTLQSVTQSLPVLMGSSWLANTAVLIQYHTVLDTNSCSIFLIGPERLRNNQRLISLPGQNCALPIREKILSENHSHPFRQFVSISYQISTQICFLHRALCFLSWQRPVRIFCICLAVMQALKFHWLLSVDVVVSKLLKQ